MSAPKVSVNRRSLFLFAVALAIIALDQISKALVRRYLPLNTSWDPIPGLGQIVTFTHVHNTGAAFGLFPGLGTVFLAAAMVVVLLIIAYSGQLARATPLLRIAFGLQLGGAAGNLIDRLTQGYVTDFIDFRVWAVFNVADSAVVIGTVLLAYYALFTESGQEDFLASRSESRRSDEPNESWSEGHGE